ncbi:MAG: hypothetical protein BWZ10_00123 [candidate division BRC1 bacterium ADurb.BinA364]|nr:MAG: hypothetical protein BWZ10_00123 [candidate division BRC1 bacterium ADurb.BinA364]
MKYAVFAFALLFAPAAQTRAAEAAKPGFNPKKDLLSLHYDHAPDKDDGHSAAADITLLAALFDADWIKARVIAVSGAVGKNRGSFNHRSDAVMDASWNEWGGWIAAIDQWDEAVETLTERWMAALKEGGDIWIKEGGQSDITAAIVRNIKQRMPDVDTRKRIHLIQHGLWNEKQTTDEDLAYVRAETDYVKIRNANAYLNVKGGDETFVRAATAHPVHGNAWKAAFDYYAPSQRVDFSDTGELLHILGLGEMNIDEFRQRYLDPK